MARTIPRARRLHGEPYAHPQSSSLACGCVLPRHRSRRRRTGRANTGEWTCSKCPFPKGYQADATLGGGYLDDSSAKFGQYTGLDDKGGYVVADAEGSYTAESGYGFSYELTDLGLDSRAIDIEGGRQGAYEFGLHYDRVPGAHLGHDADAVRQRRQQEPDAAGELGFRWQHRRHDVAGRGPARGRRRLRPRSVRRRREILLGPERRAGSRLQAGRAQRFPQPVRHDRQHVDAAAHAARRRDRPRRRGRPLPGRALVRRADLQRLVLQHQGRLAEVDQSLRPVAARHRRGPDGAGAGQRLQRDRAVGRMVRPAGQHDDRAVGRDRQGHAGNLVPAVHHQPDHRDPAAADVEPARRRRRDPRRPDSDLAAVEQPAPARLRHLRRARQQQQAGGVRFDRVRGQLPDLWRHDEPVVRVRALQGLRQRRL